MIYLFICFFQIEIGSSWCSMVIRVSVFRQLLVNAALFLSQLLCQMRVRKSNRERWCLPPACFSEMMKCTFLIAARRRVEETPQMSAGKLTTPVCGGSFKMFHWLESWGFLYTGEDAWPQGYMEDVHTSFQLFTTEFLVGDSFLAREKNI